MGKRRHGMPDKFQWEGFAVDERPASEDAAAAAMLRFVKMFVIKSIREPVQAKLLHKDPRRRSGAIHNLYMSIDPALQAELKGNTGFPQHLKERFGDLRGIITDGWDAYHVTIAGAAVHAAESGLDAIFIADVEPIALFFPDDGQPPILCSRR